MTKSAACFGAVGHDPLRGSGSAVNVTRIAGHVIQRAQCDDHPTVFSRVDVMIDGRIGRRAALHIVQRVERFAVPLRGHVSILAGIERTVGAGEKCGEIAVDCLGHRQIPRIVPIAICGRVQTDVLGLERHDLFEVW